MQSKPATTTTARIAATAGLAALGLLHGAWAAGSSWPADSPEALAEAVVGAPSAPARLPTIVVAAGLTGAAVLVSGRVGRSPLARIWLRVLQVALLTRGALGGTVAAEVITGTPPSATFRRLDRVLYRPLCLTLGVAVALSR
ncbi:DUF3995 domain-containing protein [Microbacterium testaceum]|uniref:DUF3995 domain-containing protein n=1 Tax=Microbacterium testaceum TaxID=2033 RepID=UPI001785988E|nr:DUF3995 domain-containing protein [Microbacterium testaceum]